MLSAAYIGGILMEIEFCKLFRTFYVVNTGNNLIQTALQVHGVLYLQLILMQDDISMLQSYPCVTLTYSTKYMQILA